jgi:hypothetical protein
LERLFDFGDNRLFEVRLERLEPANPKLREPTAIDGRGQAPPRYPNFDDGEWDEEKRDASVSLAYRTESRQVA